MWFLPPNRAGATLQAGLLREAGWSGMSGRRLSLTSAGTAAQVKAAVTPADAGAYATQELTQMTVQDEATTKGIVLTDAAAVKVSSLLQQEGRDDLRLRIAVQPGGCSGLRYQLYFDEREMDGDFVSEFGTVQVVTDKMSVPYLMGATIDFVDTIEKQGFTIDNPNATGSCACGDSFH
jgi:iron-sulfur cluster assembly accessory protein